MFQENLSLGKLGLIIFDLVCINISYILVLVLWMGYLNPETIILIYLHAAPWISLEAFLIFHIFDLYSGWIHRVFRQVVYSLILAAVIINLLALGILFLNQTLVITRVLSISTVAIQIFLFALFRLPIWYYFQRSKLEKRVLVVGKDVQESKSVAKKFSCHAKGKYDIQILIYSEDIMEIERKIKSSEIDIVAISSNLAGKGKLIDLCIKEHKEIFLVPDIMAVLLNSSETRYVDDTLMLALKPPGIKRGQQHIKRCFDIVSSLIFLGVLSPIMILIVISIHLTSPGPALFQQERLGENGKPFKVFKFRSMINNAEWQTGPVLATDKDPRITKFGSFLRITRLDEIPQFINVLRGEMSLVGPRPEREFFVNQFTETIPYYRYRMEVKPGITGLAQVMGKYTTSPEDKLRLDLMYIRNYSLLMDIKILLLTARVIFQREKAIGAEVNYKDAMEKMAG
ncbi:MAG: sugar transferase [Peptococcaceae bacterium]|nr:sugar transferase [Peptococcaceae bacterium]